jgi:5-formyltetrahydrofolate cyclo-ligase
MSREEPELPDPARRPPGSEDLADGAGAGRPAGGAALAAAKEEFRRRIHTSRARLSARERAAAASALRDAVLSLPQADMAGTVAAYYSLASEPDTHGLVYALWKRGSYVLLPVLRPGNDLDWASYEGPHSLRPGPRGVTEPEEPPRGVTSVARADLVIVPALAVDRRGYRLGRGGGSYDRALARVGPNVVTIALLYDGELVGQLPAGPHDQRVRLAALPSRGIISLPSG